jgi:hypothetical protein
MNIKLIFLPEDLAAAAAPMAWNVAKAGHNLIVFDVREEAYSLPRGWHGDRAIISRGGCAERHHRIPSSGLFLEL